MDTNKQSQIGGLSQDPSTGVQTADLRAHLDKDGTPRTPRESDSANEWYYKKQEAELNHRYALDAWERENEYNTPENIAKRLRAAGINPRVAFGNGSGQGGSIDAGSASGSYGKSDVSQNVERATQIGGMVGDLATRGVGIAESVSGMKNLSAQTDFTEAQTEGVKVENTYKETQILASLQKTQMEIEKLIADTGVSEEQKKNLIKQRDAIDASINEANERILFSQQGRKESEQRIAESKQNIAESKQNVKSSKQGVTESKQRVSESEARMQKIEQDVAYWTSRNTFFEKFGFYPPSGDNWQSALIGLGVKGIGKFAEMFNELKGNPDTLKNTPVELLEDWGNAKTEKEKEEVMKKIVNVPVPQLSRGVM